MYPLYLVVASAVAGVTVIRAEIDILRFVSSETFSPFLAIGWTVLRPKYALNHVLDVEVGLLND